MSEVANKVPKLRFPEFNQPLLADILLNLTDILRCGIAATPKYVDSGITFLSSQNVTSTGKISMEKYNFISEDYYKKISKNSKLLKGDILYSRVGARYGNAAIFPFEGDYGVYVSLTHIRASQQLNNTFLKFLLNSPIGKIQAKKGVFQGGGVPNLNVKIVEKFKINFPAKPEQQKIASFLSSVDNKIEQLSKKQALLGEYKKGLTQQIFSQEIRFKADNGSSFPDWEEKKLGDCLSHKSKKNKNNEVDLVLSVSNKKGFITQDEQFDGYQVASKDLTNYKIVKKGEYAYNPSRINVGSIARLKNNSIGIVSPMYVVFKLKNLDSIFFDNLYQTHLFKHLIKVGCSGSVRDSLNFNDMADFVFSFPSLEEQIKIANFLSSIDSKIEQVGEQLNESKQFKKALLQQMFV